MRVNDIFSEIHNRMIEGEMMHHSLCMYFEFLGLNGFGEMQNMRCVNEREEMVELERYFVRHYRELLNPSKLEIVEYAPESWYEVDSNELGSEDVRRAVEEFIRVWVEWEEETKKKYEIAFGNLCDLREYAGSIFVKKLVKGVDYEFSFAYRLWLDLKRCNFDAVRISDVNDKICKMYKCMKERKGEEYEHKSEYSG